MTEDDAPKAKWWKKKSRPVPCPIDCEHEYNHVKYGRLWYNVKMRILHRELRHERIMITIIGKEEATDQGTEPKYIRTDTWARYKPKQLESFGFRKAEGVPGYDSVVFWGVPIYVKITGMQHANLPEDSDRIAETTASTLNDYLRSNATEAYKKGLTKTTLPTMDLQKLAMLGILIVGAVLGLIMMGVI